MLGIRREPRIEGSHAAPALGAGETARGEAPPRRANEGHRHVQATVAPTLEPPASQDVEPDHLGPAEVEGAAGRSGGCVVGERLRGVLDVDGLQRRGGQRDDGRPGQPRGELCDEGVELRDARDRVPRRSGDLGFCCDLGAVVGGRHAIDPHDGHVNEMAITCRVDEPPGTEHVDVLLVAKGR